MGEDLVVSTKKRVDVANIAGERDPVAIGRYYGGREAIGFSKGVESRCSLAGRLNIGLNLFCLSIIKIIQHG